MLLLRNENFYNWKKNYKRKMWKKLQLIKQKANFLYMHNSIQSIKTTISQYEMGKAYEKADHKNKWLIKK